MAGKLAAFAAFAALTAFLPTVISTKQIPTGGGLVLTVHYVSEV